jgi:hypothetical protein
VVILTVQAAQGVFQVVVERLLIDQRRDLVQLDRHEPAWHGPHALPQQRGVVVQPSGAVEDLVQGREGRVELGEGAFLRPGLIPSWSPTKRYVRFAMAGDHIHR